MVPVEQTRLGPPSSAIDLRQILKLIARLVDIVEGLGSEAKAEAGTLLRLHALRHDALLLAKSVG